MKLGRMFAAASVLFILAGEASQTFAAEIDMHENRVNLSGEIVHGDAEKFVTSLLKSQVMAASLYVSSSGGDLVEALRIADIVKGLRFQVFVAKGKTCISSCFFIWLAGASRYTGYGLVNDDGILAPQARRERAFGVIGIHRPYLKNPLGTPDATARQEEGMRKVRNYLVSVGLAQYLIDEMMSRPSNDVYWLRAKDIESIGEHPPGIEETLITKCGYKRPSKAFQENWSEEKEVEVMRCSKDIVIIPRVDYLAFSMRLKNGWRPWSLREIRESR